jgi:hypothetical protein
MCKCMISEYIREVLYGIMIFLFGCANITTEERPLTQRIQPIYCGPLKGPSSEKPLPRKRPAYSGSLEEPSSEEPRKRGRPANPGTVVLKR